MTAPNTTNNVTVRKLADVAEGMWNKSKNAFVNASGDTMTGRLTMEKVPINQIVTGTGTAATSSSSGGTTTYYPAKWNFDLGIATPSAGDQLVIKIPVAGHDYGVWISTDNGITYFPVARNYGTSRLTTHYPNGAYICVVFETYIASNTNSGAVNDVYPVAGGTSRINPRIGCWRVLNDYDSGNTYDRLYTANGRFRTGSTGCFPYSLVCLDNTQSYSMLVTSNSGTGTNKAINTDGKFVYPASILYYAANNTVGAGTIVASTYNTYIAYPSLDIRYSSNHTVTFTTNKPVYIECTLNGDGTWSPTSNSITQTLRTGYYYIFLGIAYSTEYQVSLAPEHPLYYYDGTNLVSAEVARGDITAGTNNGELKVAGTDITVYTHPTDAGNKHIPAGGSSGQFLGYDSDGTAKWVSNPNTDTKVKATAKTDNANYKILATASASPTSGAATEAVYDTDITLNPSTNTISANVSGTAASAGKLTTARTTYVTLGTASTSTTRDWSGTTTIPVSGTLGLGNGGTGATSAAGARTNLDVYSKSETESLLNGKVVIVTVLPATGEAGKTYYVKDTSATGVDKYDEYIWAVDAGATTESWIHVGEKSLDLSEYVNALTTSGTGPLVKSLSKSGNTLTATLGTIAIDNLSDWASSTDVTVSSVTYHTWWPVAPTSSNQVYGLSIYNGRLYRVYNNKGTYSVQNYDANTTYTNKSLGQGYGTCATEAATAAKIVTMSEYALTTGGIVTVNFTNALCTSATMNINGKGAKPIYIKGAAVTANNAATVSAGDTAYFMYDGTAYHLLGTDRAATNPIVNISRSGTTFTATRLDGTTFTFTQQDNNTTYTQAKLGQGYGTCTTAEATAAKSVTLTGYELEPNGVVAVKFTNGLCASATMSINGKTATPIYINGAAVTSTSCKEVLAGDIAFFIYDGSHYQFICTDRISKNGITGLSISGKTITYTRADGSTGTLTTQDTTYTFDGVYNSSSNKAATVSTVTNAVNALDVDDITGFGAGKTLATLTETDGKIAATFQNISITKSQVSDFSHAHGNITNDGKIGSTANLPVITGTSGSVTTGSFATSTVAVDTSSSAGTANTFSRGDHKHSISLATGDAPGQVKIAGTNVDVKGWDNKQSYYDATFTRSYKNTSNCWAKLASMSLDLSTTSEVSGAWEIFASGQWAQVGIVNFHTKITASAETSSYSENALYWIGDTAAIDRGYNFCMVLKPKAASGQPVVMELWGLCTTRYQGIGIREIGGTGSSAERDPAHTWVYYNPTDSDIGAKPSATEGTVIVDPIPHTQTKSVLKNFTIPAGQVSYVKIMTPTGQHQKMVVYSADGTNLHGECILRTYNDGNPSSGRCQVLALGGNPRRWFGKANEQYIEFDWTAESSNRAFRFGITELSGGDSVNFELVDSLPSGTTEITPTGMTPASHSHGNITNDGTLTDTAAAAAGNDYVVIRDADNAKIQTSTIKGTDVADAVSKKHSHSTLTLSTTAQAYDGSHTLALPSTDPYTSARTPTSHTHGNIQNGGTLQTTDVAIANGDKLVITDASDSNKVARASAAFDGSTTSKVLTQKGTFESISGITPEQYYLPANTATTNTLDPSKVTRYQSYSFTSSDWMALCLLYDITEFCDGTIVNNSSESSLFTGTIIEARINGNSQNNMTNVCAQVNFTNPLTARCYVLSSDSARCYPIILKESVDRVSTWTTGLYDFTIGSAPVAVQQTGAKYAEVNCTAGDEVYISASLYDTNLRGYKVWAFVNSSGNVISTSDSYKYNGAVTVPANAAKLIVQTRTAFATESVCGLKLVNPRYYLAIRYTDGSASSDTYFGRWYTRTTATSSVSARPALMTRICNFGEHSAANLPAGYEVIKSANHTVAALTADNLLTARQLAVSLSNTSTTTTFDGSTDVTNIKVTGTLPVANGGTGKTTVTAAEYNLLSHMGTELTGEMNNDRLFAFAYSTQNETNGRLAGYRKASTVWSWIKDKLASDTNVDISGHADSATHDGNGNTISDNSVYYVVGTTDYPAWQASHAYAINDYAISGGKAYYCKTAHTSGTSFDSSKWTAVATPVIKGTVSNVSALFAGMKIALKWPITGGSSSTYLNINNLGNVYIRRNDGNTTTHVPANTVTFLAYDGTYWRWSDYDSNSTYSGMVTAYLNNAGDAAKSVSSTNFRLTDGITIILTNNVANTKAAALTLNVNSTGAKALYINGNISSSTNYTIPIGTYFCHYKVVNGTGQWHLWTDGTAHFTKLHLDTPLPDAEIASAATWNAKQDAITYMTVAQENELISELGEL